MVIDIGGETLRKQARIKEAANYAPLYDESPPLEDGSMLELNAGLTDDQITDALFWAQFRNGLMLVSGEPGEGKGVLSNMIGWKFGRYFPGCKRILDYLPRRPMGYYHHFTQQFIVDQVDRMALLAKGEVSQLGTEKEKAKTLEEFKAKCKDWVSSEGSVFFRNSIIVLDEYRKRHNKRRPHDALGILLTDIYNVRRHLNTLIVGVTVKPAELDEKTCIPHVKFHVKMRRACDAQDYDNPRYHTFIASVHRTRYDVMANKLMNIGKPYRFPIDAAKERPEMGDKPAEYAYMTYDSKSPYYCWYDTFNSENAIALNVPKSLRKEQ